MKFLCVTCDTAMKLEGTPAPQGGTLTAVFVCGTCGHRTALLTNPMETQMVRSLGVTVGGRPEPVEPMSLIRGSLAGAGRPGGPARSAPAAESAAGAGESASRTSEGKCPFSGVVSEAMAGAGEPIPWTLEARRRIERVPEFAQPMVKMGVEMHARQHGMPEITEAVIDEVKARFGM